MKKLYQILTELRSRDVQRYLDEAHVLTHQWKEFLKRVPEMPPDLEKSRILLLMVPRPRCLYSAVFALRFAYQFNADLYVLHQGVLAPLIRKQADELRVNIPFDHKVEKIQRTEIEHLVKEHAIQLIVTVEGIPTIKRVLNDPPVPVLFLAPPS